MIEVVTDSFMLAVGVALIFWLVFWNIHFRKKKGAEDD